MTNRAAGASMSLAGQKILVTRERPGELGRLLTERGAEVVHVPLIAIEEPADGGFALRRELGRLDTYDWLVVTSAAGSERVGDIARVHAGVRLACVGTTTAEVLAEIAGRPADLVPERQVGADLAEALCAEIDRLGGDPAEIRVLVAQADRAVSTLVDALRAADLAVTAVTAYSTVLVQVDPARLTSADVLALASGSAARSWAEATKSVDPLRQPALTVAIGPTTAQVARDVGLKVDGVATDHSLNGLIDEIERHVRIRRTSGHTAEMVTVVDDA